MKELLVARRGLVKDRAAARNRDQTHRSPLLNRIAAQRLRQIERQLAAIDAALQVQCTADPALKARFDILVSIPGIGEITALILLIEMPELGTIENKCVASLGLARAGRPRFRPAQRKALYPRRPGSPSASPLYASPRRHKIQCRTERKISGLHRRRKAAKSRAHRHHAKARYPRQRLATRSAGMDTKPGLTKTDTLLGARLDKTSDAGLASRRAGRPDMIYAQTRQEIAAERKVFIRKWRPKCRAVADSLEEAGGKLFTCTRFPASQWKSIRTSNAIECLHEEFKRRIKTQTVLPSAGTAAMLFWALLAPGQITMRKVDGRQSLAAKPSGQTIDLAA